MSSNVPSEHDEQVAVVRWLQENGVEFFAVPNGAFYGNPRQGVRMRAEGLTPGVADLIIIDPAPNVEGAVLTALEMKRRQGGRLTAVQRSWLNRQASRPGWVCIVGMGAEDAIQQLEALGYG